MVTKLKKNRFARDLFTKKYNPRVIKQKKAKEVFKEEKVKVLLQFVELPLLII